MDLVFAFIVFVSHLLWKQYLALNPIAGQLARLLKFDFRERREKLFLQPFSLFLV